MLDFELNQHIWHPRDFFPGLTGIRGGVRPGCGPSAGVVGVPGLCNLHKPSISLKIKEIRAKIAQKT